MNGKRARVEFVKKKKKKNRIHRKIEPILASQQIFSKESLIANANKPILNSYKGD